MACRGTVRQNELETEQAVSYSLRMTKHSPFRYFKTSPEVSDGTSNVWDYHALQPVWY